MDEGVAEETLNALSRIVRDERQDTADGLVVPEVEAVGLLQGGEERSEGPAPEPAYTLYRDGLAVLSPSTSLEMDGQRVWLPQEGLLRGSQ